MLPGVWTAAFYEPRNDDISGESRRLEFGMEDLATRIQALSELARIPMLHELIRIDAVAQARTRGGRRARLGTADRNRSETARWESNRLGQIIYFLRFRSPATNTSAEDMALCEMLAVKLRAKNDWTGEIDN